MEIEKSNVGAINFGSGLNDSHTLKLNRQLLHLYSFFKKNLIE